MADKPKTIEQAASEPATEQRSEDITLLQTDAVILISALELLNAAHLADTVKHQHEIDHPSLFNPQVEMHRTKRDEFAKAVEYNNALIASIAKPFGIDLAPQLQVIVTDEAEGVKGPAEENRPPSANPGSTNSNQV